jgi:hypothetical protein
VHPGHERDRDRNPADRRDVIERDTGTGVGVALAVVLAVFLAAALMWFILGGDLLGAGVGGGTP